MTQFLAGDRSENIDEYEQYCKDGTIKTIEISIKLIFSVDVLGVSRNVTYKKKSSPNQKLFKTELGIDINDAMKDLYDTFINREYT